MTHFISFCFSIVAHVPRGVDICDLIETLCKWNFKLIAHKQNSHIYRVLIFNYLLSFTSALDSHNIFFLPQSSRKGGVGWRISSYKLNKLERAVNCVT